MPKINDIEPPKRSIRDISINRHISHGEPISDILHSKKGHTTKGRKSIDEEPPFFSYVKERENSVVYDYSDQRRGLSPVAKFMLWGVAGVSCLAVVFAVFSFFSGATVTITPLEKKFTVDGLYTAKTLPEDGGIKFDVISLTKEEKKTIQATGVEKVSQKAVGEIIVYNNHSSASQSLVTNTRFVTEDGLIFRLKKDTIVPGRKLVNGTTTPGSIKVSVIADEAGEKYNIGLADFTIPGFKGTTKYNNFYARSVDKMTGGFVGEISKVSPDDLANAEKELAEKLSTSLAEAISLEVPSGFILYTNAIKINLGKAIPKSTTDIKVSEVNLSGTASAIIFNKEKLEKFIVDTLGLEKGQEIIKVYGVSKLLFDIATTNFNPEKDTSLSFKLGGTVSVVWTLDEDIVKKALAGKGKNELSSVLGSYPSVVKAESYIVPLWQNFYPDNVEKIKVEQIITAKDD